MSLSQSSKRPWKKNLHFLVVETNFKLEHAFYITSLKYCHRMYSRFCFHQSKIFVIV